MLLTAAAAALCSAIESHARVDGTVPTFISSQKVRRDTGLQFSRRISCKMEVTETDHLLCPVPVPAPVPPPLLPDSALFFIIRFALKVAKPRLCPVVSPSCF